MTESENTQAEISKIGNVQDINALKKVIISLLSNLDDSKYKTEIIKLCFILDYKYCKGLKVNIGPTTVEYVKYNYGPYSESFVEAFEQLINEGLIIQVSMPFGAGYIIKDNNSIDLDENTAKFLKEVIAEFGKSTLREMKSYIYDTEEFKNTEFGKKIIFN